MYNIHLLLLIIIFIWSYIVSYNFRGLEVPQLPNRTGGEGFEQTTGEDETKIPRGHGELQAYRPCPSNIHFW